MVNRFGKILGIDPGPIDSAYCLIDSKDAKPIEFGIVNNEVLIKAINNNEDINNKSTIIGIEMIKGYGQKAGNELFETCRWIGRFEECSLLNGFTVLLIGRKKIVSSLTGTVTSGDSVMRKYLINRFGNVGTKKNPGWFFGFKKDVWSSYCVAIYIFDKRSLYVK